MSAPNKLVKTKTSGIYKRGASYVVVWREPNRRQRRKTFRTIEEARAWKGKVTGKRNRNMPMVLSRPFDEFARDWVATYTGRTSAGVSKRTRDAYEQALERHVIPYFGAKKVSDITAPDVRGLVAVLADGGLKPASILKTIAPLKAMFSQAVEDGMLGINPCQNVRVNAQVDDDPDDPEGDEPVRIPTREQLAVFLKNVSDPMRILFELLAVTGLRISECLGLDWQHVTVEGKPGELQLRVRQQFYRGDLTRRLKTKAARRAVPLSPTIARRLWAERQRREAALAREYQEQGASPADARIRARAAIDVSPVFTTTTGTRWLDGNLRRRVLAPARKKAGVPWLGFHGFRHLCASELIASGRDVVQVAAWLGHKDPNVTLRVYGHLLAHRGVGDALDIVAPTNPTDSPEPPTALRADNPRTTNPRESAVKAASAWPGFPIPTDQRARAGTPGLDS